MSARVDRIGETNIANNGLKMTIVAYRNSNDLDIQFEDGVIITNKNYYNFIHGSILHPSIKTKDKQPHIYHIGESNYNKAQKLKMTIVDWTNNKNIQVQFEDGTIVNTKYNNFKSGAVSNPNYDIYKQYIGQTNKTTKGQTITIIAIRNKRDLDIQFEDGTIRKNIQLNRFITGDLQNPNFHTYKDIQKNKIGETAIAGNGLKMTIIAYRGYNDIDIQFEDGTIVTNKSYSDFKHKKVKHPKINTKIIKMIDQYIGMTNISTNGQKITIIDYRNSNDIDVQFEDNTIIKHTSINAFKKGQIKNTNYRINDSNMSSTIGQKMTIKKYNSATDIDVEFEDGYIAYNKVYSSFKKGTIKHEFPYQMNDMLIEKFAYIHNNIGNFYCKCLKCKHSDIMTVDEMKNHICKD